MTAIKSGDLQRFRTSGWRDYPVVLVHGSDDGAIRELSVGLAAAASGIDADPMNLVVLEGDAIAQDPPRLADELQTFGLFGGNRVVHIRNAGKAPIAAIETAAETMPQNTFLLLEAGELKAGTGLRALCDKHRRIASLACYADSAKSLQAMIDSVLKTHALGISPDAREFLVSALGADHGLSRSEVEKLALYARGEGQITLEMVLEIVSDASRHETGNLLDQVFLGQIAVIETEANRIFAAGTNPAGLLTQAIGQVIVLRRLVRAAGSGGPIDLIMKQSRVHYSREPLVRRAISLWSEARLDRALRIVADALLQTRRTARLAETLAIRSLWGVSRLARSD